MGRQREEVGHELTEAGYKELSKPAKSEEQTFSCVSAESVRFCR